MASSRVGVTTSARGPGPLRSRSRSTMGRRKARLLPDPVGASITTSSPSRRAGTASAWTASGSVMPWRARAARVRAFTPSSANVDKKAPFPLVTLFCRDLSRETSTDALEPPQRFLRRESTLSRVISILGLEKAFGAVHAVRGVDLRVEPGEILVLLGQNGAGKSTTLRCAGGVLRPDAGAIRFGDLALPGDVDAVRRRLGV